MEITLQNSRIYLSPELVTEADIKKGDNIFVFSIKGENAFGLHKATSEMTRSILTYPVRSTPLGSLYITPSAPPVAFIRARLHLSKNKKTLSIEKLIVDDLPLYIFKK